MPRTKKPSDSITTLSLWLVYRIRRIDGTELPRPTLYGKVPALSEAGAIRHFIDITRSHFSPTQFDAIPFASGGTRV